MRIAYLAVFFLTSLSASAQNADLHFDRAFTEHGGPAVGAVQSIQIVGTSTTREGAQPIVISATLDGNLRVDYGSPVSFSRIRTPEGNFDIEDGVRTEKPAHDSRFAALDWFSVLGIRHFATGIERTSQGAASINGRATRRAHAESGQQDSFYRRELHDEVDIDFDQETGLVSAISRLQYASGSLDLTFLITTAFTDYREVGSLVLPYSIGRYLDGRLRESIAVESIVIDPFLPRDLFER